MTKKTIIKKTIARPTRPGIKKTIKRPNRSVAARARKIARNPTPRNIARAKALTPVRRAARYSAALLQGNVMSDSQTPCATSRAFREVKCTWVVRPLMADAQRCVVVYNKHLMWTDLYSFVSSVTANNAIFRTNAGITPVYYANQTGTFAPQMTQDAEGAYINNNSGQGLAEKIIPANVVSSAGTRGTTGDVRFLGGKVTFRQFETALNTGGQLLHVHNPQGLSFLAKTFNEGTVNPATVTCVNLQGMDPGVIEGLRSVTALSTVTQEPTSCVILPHTTEFETITAGVDCNSPGVIDAVSRPAQIALDAKWMEGFDQVFNDSWGSSNHYGFNEAFIYKPASTKTGGSSANCEFVFEMHYHVNVASTSTTGFGMTAANEILNAGVSDARSAAAMQTTIDAIKQARVDDPATAFTGPTGMNPALAVKAPSILEKVAQAAPDIATEISDMLPASFMGGVPKAVFAGIGTVGKLIFG